MNLGALTTAFVPGPGCNDTIYGKIYSVGTVRDKWHSLGQTDTRSCYPAAFTTPNAYYSPGICPSAWSSACGNVESIGSVTETRVTCCPVYVHPELHPYLSLFTSRFTGIRTRAITTTDTMHSGYICANPENRPWDTFSCSRFYTDPPKLIVPQELNGKTTYMETTLGGPIVVYANQIEVRFQKGDFDTAASTTGRESPPQTKTQASGLPSKTSETAEDTNTAAGGGGGTGGAGAGGESEKDGGNGSGLTAGSWAGIVVVIVAVSVVLVGLLVFFVRMRRKEGDDDDVLGGGWTDVHSAAEMANSTPACEAGHRDVGEVSGDLVMPVELDPKGRVYQLE